MYAADPWYLIRTKSNRERLVREQLAPIASDIFLPMLKLPFTDRIAHLHLSYHYSHNIYLLDCIFLPIC